MIAFLLSLFLLCLMSAVQSYVGNGYDPLGKLTEAQKSKTPSYPVNEALADEYSPVYIGPQDGLKEADKIVSSPGLPNGEILDQYSAYVTVDPAAGRALFYYFIESQNTADKPLVLWLNGGPGCSSFGNGAMMEIML